MTVKHLHIAPHYVMCDVNSVTLFVIKVNCLCRHTFDLPQDAASFVYDSCVHRRRETVTVIISKMCTVWAVTLGES